jgi:hypothetical protein
MKIIAICVCQGGLLGQPQPFESQKGVDVMKIYNENNNMSGEPVVLRLPFVARMLPFGCPSAAGKLPARCLQVAEPLP